MFAALKVDLGPRFAICIRESTELLKDTQVNWTNGRKGINNTKEETERERKPFWGCSKITGECESLNLSDVFSSRAQIPIQTVLKSAKKS